MKPTLIDRGDGVKGHFCIGREVPAELSRYGEPYWEFYNKGKWCSAGEVFIGKKAAEAKLKEILQQPPDNRSDSPKKWKDTRGEPGMVVGGSGR